MNGYLWVARHAPPLDSTMCYGRTDIAVSVPHDVAAENLLEAYPGQAPESVWTSPSSRCRLPAERLAARLGVPLKIDDALYELHFGNWEGRTWKAIALEDGDACEAWTRDWQEVPPPNGERPADIETRVRGWLTNLTPGKDHVLIAHSGVVRALSVVLEGQSWPDAMQRKVSHLAWARFSLAAS